MAKVRSIPLFMQIVDQIKQRIKSGELDSGMFLPKEVDFAKEFGVTRSTLRNALQVLEREGFIERRRSKGTMIAPKVRHNKHLRAELAVVTRLDLSNPQNYTHLLHDRSELGAALAAATKRSMLVRFIPWCADNHFFDLDELLFRKGINGFIFVSPLYLTDFIERVAEEKIPHVLLESHYERNGVNTVMTDDAGATAKCMKQLYDLGHRKIGFVGGPLKKPELNSSSRRCLSAFLETCSDLGISLQDSWVQTTGEDHWENLRVDQTPGIRHMLSTRPRPTAVVTATIRNAMAVQQVCRDLALNVPGDLSLISVGCNDSEHYLTNCTGYVKNFTALGEASLDSLMEWIADPLYRPNCLKVFPDPVDNGTLAPSLDKVGETQGLRAGRLSGFPA